MASKPELIPSNTLPRAPLPARPHTPPPEALRPSMAPSVLVDEVQHKTPPRARTRTWPLLKADQALVSPPSGPCPTTPLSPTALPKGADARPDSAKLPKLNLQAMLEQLDRDMADCPYYEVYGFDGPL